MERNNFPITYATMQLNRTQDLSNKNWKIR